jgi:hypothetical protein
MKLTWIFGFAAAGVLCAQPEHVMVRSGGVIATAPTAGIHMERMSLSPVKGAPYSAEAATESVQTLADGNRISNRQTSRTWRDSEGRTRMEHEMRAVGPWVASGEGMNIVMIDDPVAKEHITLNPARKTATKFSVSNAMALPGGAFFSRSVAPPPDGAGMAVMVEKVVANTAEAPLAPPKKDVMMWKQEGGPDMVIKHAPADVKKTSLGKQMMEGVEVEGTREVMTIPAGEMGNERPIEVVTERWVSSALQIDILRKHTDPRFGETTYKVTGLSRSEPARALFEIPADYKVESPDVKIMKRDQK